MEPPERTGSFRNRSIVGLVALLAIVAWGSLLTFMQRQPPTLPNQIIFMIMFAGGVVCSTIPFSYALNSRFAPSLGMGGDMNRALRQGLMAGLVGGVLMGLHIMQMLPPERALVLVAIVILVELLFYIRRR